MNIPLAWECSELRLGKRRLEKEKMDDSRGEVYWTPPIYNPTTSVHCEGEKTEVDQNSKRKPGNGRSLCFSYRSCFSAAYIHLALKWNPPADLVQQHWLNRAGRQGIGWEGGEGITHRESYCCQGESERMCISRGEPSTGTKCLTSNKKGWWANQYQAKMEWSFPSGLYSYLPYPNRLSKPFGVNNAVVHVNVLQGSYTIKGFMLTNQFRPWNEIYTAVSPHS